MAGNELEGTVEDDRIDDADDDAAADDDDLYHPRLPRLVTPLDTREVLTFLLLVSISVLALAAVVQGIWWFVELRSSSGLSFPYDVSNALQSAGAFLNFTTTSFVLGAVALSWWSVETWRGEAFALDDVDVEVDDEPVATDEALDDGAARVLEAVWHLRRARAYLVWAEVLLVLTALSALVWGVGFLSNVPYNGGPFIVEGVASPLALLAACGGGLYVTRVLVAVCRASVGVDDDGEEGFEEFDDELFFDSAGPEGAL